MIDLNQPSAGCGPMDAPARPEALQGYGSHVAVGTPAGVVRVLEGSRCVGEAIVRGDVYSSAAHLQGLRKWLCTVMNLCQNTRKPAGRQCGRSLDPVCDVAHAHSVNIGNYQRLFRAGVPGVC
jgi:hypothetical protein